MTPTAAARFPVAYRPVNRLLSALARVALVIPLLACGATPRVPAAARTQELPWIRDDAPRALAEAKRSGKPLFVEFGAAWCKACVSMGEYAFQDPALIEELGERAVWLSIDVENPANAPFVEAHRHKNYPTFTVLGSGAEQSWTGYFQAEEFISVFRVALLGDAEACDGRTASRVIDALVAALHRAVAFRRFRAADVRSILAAGTGTPQPRPAGDALVLDLPVAPTRSLDAYKITLVADGEVIS